MQFACNSSLEGVLLLHIGGSVLLGDVCMVLAGVNVSNRPWWGYAILLRRGMRGRGAGSSCCQGEPRFSDRS